MFKFLRWLLVPLLPLIGLIAGQWLTPIDSSRWQVNFDGNVAVLGLGFADHGNILLLGETDYDPIKKTVSHRYTGIIGLDTKTGKQLFQTRFNEEVLQGKSVYGAYLYNDNSHIVLSTDLIGSGWFEVLIYDWRNQKVTHRYGSSSEHGFINSPYFSGETVAAYGAAGDAAGKSHYKLVVWHGKTKQPFVIPIDSHSKHGLSQDGEMAHVLQHPSSPHRLILVNVKQQSKIQELHGPFYEVCWSPDHFSFIAVEYDLDSKAFIVKRYVLKDQKYIPDNNFVAKALLSSGAEVRLSRSHIIVRTFTSLDPWYKKLAPWLNTQLRFIINRLWPSGHLLQLHDIDTGKLIHRVVIPMGWQLNNYFTHPDGQSLALCDSRQVALWDFYPTSRYYPLLGLVAGLLLATLLAWKLLRHQPRKGLPLSPESGAA